MKLRIRQLNFLLLTLAALVTLSACGESFTGKYAGDVQVVPAECPGTTRGAYSIEVQATISGNDIEIAILRMVNKENGMSSDLTSKEFEGISGSMGLSGSTAFAGQGLTYENAPGILVDIEGNVNTARDELNNLAIIKFDDNRSCTMKLVSTSPLTLVP